MLAYTGLETVANLAEETRKPGVQLPQSLFAGIGAVVVMYVGIAIVGCWRSRRATGRPRSAPSGCGAPLMGIVDAFGGAPAGLARDVLRGLRRPFGRSHPARRGDHVDVRLRAARLLARRARTASARLRAPAPPDAGLAAVDPRGGRRSRWRSCSSPRFAGQPVSSSRASSASASCSPSRPRRSP